MNVLKLIKEIINFIYIFSIVNDNFVVGILGSSSLKVLFVIFFVVNVMSLIRFNYRKKVNKRFLLLMLMLLLAFIFNLKNYSDLQQPLLSVLSVFMIYVVASSYKQPRILMTYFLISVFFSSLICITSDTTLSEYTFRKTGGTGDPNEFSMMLLVAIGYLAGKLRVQSSVLCKFVNIVTLLVYFVALFMAGSKSAMLVLVILALVYYILLLRSKTIRSRIRNTAVYLLLFSLIAFILWKLNGEMILNVLERFEDNSSAGERFISWAAGLELWLKTPLIGIGPQNYVNMVANSFPYIAEASRAAHSIYIQSFVETGLMGFAAFILFISYSVKNAYHKYLPTEFILGFIAILLMGITLAAFFEKYVWFYLGIICNPYILQHINIRRQ